MSQLAVLDDQQTWSPQQLAALQQLGVSNAPRGDLEVFFHQAQRTGLDPFTRQIYMISRRQKDGDSWVTKWTIQTSIDGFREVARRTGKYRGQTAPQWCGPDGVWRDVIGNDEEILAARVGIHWEGYDEPVWGVAFFDEYVQTKRDGTPTQMWQKFRRLMIAKCAEALGFRKAAPDYFSGLYTAEEMGQAETAPADAPERAPQQQAQPTAQQERFATLNWALQIADASTVPELGQVFARAQEAGELGLPFAPEHQQHVDALVQLFELSRPPAGVKVGQMIGAVKVALEKQAAEQVVEGEVIDEPTPADDPDPVQAWETQTPIDHTVDEEERVTEWPTAQPGGGQAA